MAAPEAAALVPAPAPAVAPVSAPAAPVVAATATVAKKAERKPLPIAGSNISYGHGGTALSFNRAAQPMYNPVWYQHLDLTAEYHLNPHLFARAAFGLAQELTMSDDTTHLYEVVASDLSLEGGVSGLVLPGDLKVGSTVRLVLPTSKAAHVATRLFALGLGGSASRKFNVASGLVASYSARFNWRFHRATTGETDSAELVTCGLVKTDACMDFFNTGVRNAWGDLSHGPTLAFQPLPMLSFSASFLFADAFLYRLSPAPASLGSANGLDTSTDPGFRAANRFGLSAGWDLLAGYNLGLSVETAAPQLGPDGRYRNPFFNQYTTLSLDLTVDLDEALARVL